MSTAPCDFENCRDVFRLTLRQLQIFVAVAQSGSTTAASTGIALSQSQSATSAAVNELERLLSLQLFDRTGKRLQLNDNGRALLPRALALLRGAQEVERVAHNATAQLQSLRIGASTTMGNHVLPVLLATFCAKVCCKSSSRPCCRSSASFSAFYSRARSSRPRWRGCWRTWGARCHCLRTPPSASKNLVYLEFITCKSDRHPAWTLRGPRIAQRNSALTAR
ncbi:MAG: LysR family transcriptional regulator [Burkholderiaceae bacterium]|nr:LysR family transcriptional regulator [Burkholderiaceae bacterium]